MLREAHAGLGCMPLGGRRGRYRENSIACFVSLFLAALWQ